MMISADTWALVIVSLFNSLLLAAVTWLSMRRSNAKQEGVLFNIWLMMRRPSSDVGEMMVPIVGASGVAAMVIGGGSMGIFGREVGGIIAGVLGVMWGSLLIITIIVLVIAAVRYEHVHWENR